MMSITDLVNRIEELEKVLRDTDRDLINKIAENEDLRKENSKLKDDIQKLKNENINKIKASYERKLKKMQVELEQMEGKVYLQSKPRQITDKQIKEIKELLEQGLSYRKIADKTKWSINTISKIKNGKYD